MQQAVCETILEKCPNWKTEHADLKLCNKIQKETERKRSPRQDWLQDSPHAEMAEEEGQRKREFEAASSGSQAPPVVVDTLFWYEA